MQHFLLLWDGDVLASSFLCKIYFLQEKVRTHESIIKKEEDKNNNENKTNIYDFTIRKIERVRTPRESADREGKKFSPHLWPSAYRAAR